MFNIVCKQCHVTFQYKNTLKKLCEGCVSKNITMRWKKNNAKVLPKYSMEQYRNNFTKVTEYNGYTLTPNGFKEVSVIPIKAYTNFFRKTWLDVLNMYGKLNKLYEYIKNEYLKNNCRSIRQLCIQHKYITQSFANLLDHGALKDISGISIRRHKDKDYVENFKNIVNIIGNIPIFPEFIQHTKISYNTYMDHYKISGCKNYDTLMKVLCENECDYLQFVDRYKKNKSTQGRKTGCLSAKYTDEDYKKNFKEVFDDYFSEFGEYPSRRVFSRISKIKSSSYRKKLNKSWTNICASYGYKITPATTKFENHVLKTVEKLLSSSYNPQHTWEWLKNDKGYNLYCDGYFEHFNLVVEADGAQHFCACDAFGGEKSFEKQKTNDVIKTNLLKDRDIKLLRIAYNENWMDEEYIRNKLNNILQV